jgi:hypothetical protein
LYFLTILALERSGIFNEYIITSQRLGLPEEREKEKNKKPLEAHLRNSKNIKRKGKRIKALA